MTTLITKAFPRLSFGSRSASQKKWMGALAVGGALLFSLALRVHAAPSDPRLPLRVMLTSSDGTALIFKSMKGLGSSTEVVEHKIIVRGSTEPIIRKIPGRLSWTDIVLKEGISSDATISNWRKQVETGQADKARRDVAISVVDNEGTEIARWNVSGAWPKSISTSVDTSSVTDGPDPTLPPVSSLTDTSGTGLSTNVEEVVLTHEGVMRVK